MCADFLQALKTNTLLTLFSAKEIVTAFSVWGLLSWLYSPIIAFE